MTAKEKATELVEKFKPFAHADLTLSIEIYKLAELDSAKDCAKIAVNEILKIVDAYPHWQLSTEELEDVKFWREVLVEIENVA